MQAACNLIEVFTLKMAATWHPSLDFEFDLFFEISIVISRHQETHEFGAKISLLKNHEQ